MATVQRSTLADFAIQERIGSGSYGTVWKAIRLLDGLPYAIKDIDLQVWS
jgi:NIMA (never in mitosis gene a)-related kinase